MENENKSHLLFVYNADNKFVSRMIDWGHKLISPSTYSCDLCSITHGLNGPKQEWANYLAKSPHNFSFYHRDEWLKRYPDWRHGFPFITKLESKEDLPLVQPKDFKSIKSIKQLVELIESRLHAN